MLIFESAAVKQLDDIAGFITATGLKVEKDPTDWRDYYENDLLRALTIMEVPAPYNPMPNCGGLFGKEKVGYALQMAMAERTSRYDAGCILALPTPSMPGHAVSILGNETQKDEFWSRFLQPPERSFFAVTEPQIGSDATAGTSRIFQDGSDLVLDAHKKVVGGAVQSDYGLIFVKDERAVGHKLVIADADTLAKLTLIRLPMHGLAAADLSEIIADKVVIDETQVLGHGLQSGLRNGFFAMNQVFERYRPIVSAQAIGVSRGILDQMFAMGVRRDILEPYFIRHKVFQQRLHDVAMAYETGSAKVHETSRMKLEAVQFADDVVSCLFRNVPSVDLFQSPSLLKKCRDAKGYEYMEGTTNIHVLQSFRSYTAQRAS